MNICKKALGLFAGCVLVLSVEAANDDAGQDTTETVNIQQVSEAFGHFIGRNLKSPGVEFDIESLITGIRSGANGEAAPMSDQEYEQAMTLLQEQAYETLSHDNLEAANTFMEKNKTAEGITEIEPGQLQYMLLEEGDGPVVETHSSPMIHYTGKYIDGTVFGSSEEVGGPITIPLDQTIPGFSKGIVGMKEGEKRRLFVHPDLGYGTLGNLPPNALLIFDIEVVKIDDGSENASLDEGDPESDDKEDE